MSLSSILEEIKQATLFAEEDVESGPLETLRGRRGRKTQAINSLTTLKQDYKRELFRSIVFIVVTGEKRQEFATAAEGFKCFTADTNTFYKDLASRIPASLYEGKESVSGMFDIVGRHLEDKAREIGIVGYPQLIFRQEYRQTIKNKDDMTLLIKQAVNDQVGSEVVGIQAVESITSTAIRSGHSAKITPVILSTDDDKLALDLNKTLTRLNPRGLYLVVAGKGSKLTKTAVGAISVKDPTSESVESVLKTISGNVKNK